MAPDQNAAGPLDSLPPVAIFRVPDDLAELDQWVMWSYEQKGGRTTKVPYQFGHIPASSTDPSTWTSLKDARQYLEVLPDSYNGIGYVFAENDPHCGIDLDDCIDASGRVKEWAQPIIATFADTYAEISPSGRGVKIWAKGKLPGSGKKVVYGDGAIEMYDRGRYFAVTGRALNGAPLQIEDHQADLADLYRLISGGVEKPKAKVDLRLESKFQDGQRHDHLMSVAAQFRARGMERPEILAAVLAVNQERCSPPKDRREIDAIVDWVCEKPAPPVSTSPVRSAIVPGESAAASPPDLLSQLFTDTGNAERLIAFSNGSILFCHAFKKWLIWDGQRWKMDESERSRTLAKEMVMEFLRQALAVSNDPASSFARKSLDTARITNMLREAQAAVAVSCEELDQHPFLLNFTNGTVNLQTGELRPHDREDRLTKMVHHDYRAEARCPLFLATLARLMGGGPEAGEAELDRSDRMVAYLQRAIGYSLTGATGEKVVFMAFGGGNNGKTTFLSLFQRLLEEYSAVLAIDTLMARQESSNSQADLADLRGARFVMTSETEEGQRLAEGKLKRITQGMGLIKAVRKYENPIEFQETHKLWMDANHKPVVRGTDNAVWNRLHPIPFTVTITEIDRNLPAKLQAESEGILAWNRLHPIPFTVTITEIDRNLPAKLQAESEGILAWGVAGAVIWAKQGLGRPAEVEAASSEYRAEMDQVGRFIEDSCIIVPNARVKGRQLYTAYKIWAEASGEQVVTETAFGRRLAGRRQFEKKHTESGVSYEGIGLRT